jgi:DNA repair exonuclease SbcCD ATPase subunit
MRLLSVTLQNYRIHRQLTVTFDRTLTVIGGPNECGKSTLVEAIHRALFMRYKSGGAELDRMTSHFGGRPTVTVEFEVGNRRCVVTKQFRGPSSSMVLEEQGMERLTQDRAESRLAELLGEEEPRGKWDRGRWAHVWTWQASSFEDPSEHANAYADSIVEQFQRNGGAIVQQSALDGRLADHFEKLAGSLFRNNKTAKAGTDLARAEALVEETTARVAERQESVRKLRDAATVLRRARETLAESETSRAEQERELIAVRQRKARLAELRGVLALQQKDVESAHAALEVLESRERRLVALRDQMAQQRQQLLPMQVEFQALAERERAAFEAVETSRRRSSDAELAAKRTAAKLALAEAIALRFELAAQQSTLEARASTVDRARGEMVKVQARLAALPPVDTAMREQIVSAEQRMRLAEVALEARATRIELLGGGDQVRLDGTLLNAGEARTVTSAAVLTIGGGTRVMVTPGKGNDLASVQRDLDEARSTLAAMLLEAGVESVEEASQVASELAQLTGQLETCEAELRGLNASSLLEERAELERKIAENAGIITWRQKQVADLREPTDGLSARALCDELRTAQQGDDELSALLTERLTADEESALAAREARSAFEASLAEGRAALDQYEREEVGLVASEGSDAMRASRRADAKAAYDRASAAAATTQDAIAALEPDLLDTLEAQYQQGVDRIRERQEKARSDDRFATEQLRQDGSRDPHAELDVATGEAEQAREQLHRAQVKARAIQLLAELYTREREAVSSQFTKPLCERSERYLRCVFPTASLHLSLESGAFEGLALQRGRTSGLLPFDELSVGAREQVATALRLGVAEVLAAEHDGTLPVIFDDAFAYSDADRLRRLRSMLFLASQSGLQVVVLSCTPTEYDGLGERVTLEVPTELPGRSVLSLPVAEASSDDGMDDSGEGADAEPSEPIIVSDEDCQRFLQMLASAEGSSGNMALRRELGWELDRYDAVRMHLHEQGVIIFGKGRGGTVKLVPGQ